ncbi:hypothetical protein MN608_03952 [Microdochium nivale]|nr:hypothetical protein MN608_03952 [Microdochium nivale]
MGSAPFSKLDIPHTQWKPSRVLILTAPHYCVRACVGGGGGGGGSGTCMHALPLRRGALHARKDYNCTLGAREGGREKCDNSHTITNLHARLCGVRGRRRK